MAALNRRSYPNLAVKVNDLYMATSGNGQLAFARENK